MNDLDFTLVAKKSVRGVFALISRTFLVQAMSIASFLIISLKLDPSIFGIYIVAQSIIVFFNYFQDIGLAASLIQRKSNPSLKQYRSVFTIQQLLVMLLVIPGIVFSGSLSQYYGLDSRGYYLLIALLVSFFLSSLRTIPTVMLERKLNFEKLVIPQIAENVVFNLLLVTLVLTGFETTSFTVAVLGRGVVGLVATYIIQPWRIGFSLDKQSIKELLSFGIPFQANNLLALVKDDLLVIYIGKVLPFTQVGYIGFAQKLAFYPLRLVMDNVIKITFPSYSRLQHDKNALKIAIEKSLFLISLFIFPTAVSIIVFAPHAIDLIPKYQKWTPAIASLTFFSLNTIFSSISTPLTNFLNAIGKVKVTLVFMIIWTAATWILTIYLVSELGYNGVALASFIVSTTSLGVFVVARKYTHFSFFKPVARQLFAALVMFAFLYATQNVISSILTMILEAIVSAIVYILVLMLIARDDLLSTFRFIMKSIRKQQ